MPKPRGVGRFGRLLVLSIEERASFLVMALERADMRRLCRDLGLEFHGYRTETLPAASMAKALAFEYPRDPAAAALMDGMLEEACASPYDIPEVACRPATVDLLVQATFTPAPIILPALLWHFLGHRTASVRAAARGALAASMEHIAEGVFPVPGRGSAVPDARLPDPADVRRDAGGEEALPRSVREARHALRQAHERARRAERDLGEVREQVVAARREVAARDERIAALKTALEAAERRLGETTAARAALEAARDRDVRAEARRLAVENVRLERRVETAQSGLAAARAREAELVTRLAAARTKAAEAGRPPRAGDAAAPPAAIGPGALAPSPAREDGRDAASAGPLFHVPVFSREFYASIDRRDPRIVRTAFEKIFFLAQNLAHPGIDAKAIEGLDGLYRIYIAQDVRVLYRRLPRARVEILSLIDREDLDRYVRQYRTRLPPQDHA